MDFCEGIDFVFGLSGNDVLRRLIVAIASDGCELTPPRMRERSPRDGGD